MSWGYKDEKKETIRTCLEGEKTVDFFHFVDYELSQIGRDGTFRGDKAEYFLCNDHNRSSIEQLWMEGLYHLGPGGRFINHLYHAFEKAKYSIHLITRRVENKPSSIEIDPDYENRDIYIIAYLPSVDMNDEMPQYPNKGIYRFESLEEYLQEKERILQSNSLKDYKKKNDYKNEIEINIESVINQINKGKKNRINRNLVLPLVEMLRQLLIFLYPTEQNPTKQYSAFVVPGYYSEETEKEITNGGVVVLFNNFEFDGGFKRIVNTINRKTALWSNLETTESLVSIAKDHAREAASSQLLARNFDHHIGAHILPRVRITEIEDRLDDLKQNVKVEPRYKFIEALKNKLDDYVIKRHRFLADPFQPLKNYRFYEDVILPFTENTLVMDNIAASESINYEENKKNRLKIKVFINGKENEVKATYNDIENSDGEINYPESFPYYFKYKEGSSYPEVYNSKKPQPLNLDVEVALPDSQAIYSILENVIRNSAKHNEKELNKENESGEKRDLVITIDLIDKEEPDYYSVEIYDNISHVSDFKKFKKKEEQDIINESGELVDGDLGIIDMKLCALILKGETEINEENFLKKVNEGGVINEEEEEEKKLPLQIEKHGENGNFKYVFKILKAQKICYLGDDENADGKEKEGLFRYSSAEIFLRESSKSRKFFQFAVIDADIFRTLEAESEENKEQRKKIKEALLRLPHRVIINNTAKSSSVEIFPKAGIIFQENVDDVLAQCWNAWIKHLSGEGRSSQLIVYLGEGRKQEWQKFSQNFGNENFTLTFDSDTISEDRLDCEKTKVFYDHHGNGASAYKSGFVDSDAYIGIGKHSIDFNRISFPNFPQDNEDKMFLPFEMLEAGLLKILIIDERMVEYGHKTYTNTKETPLLNRTGFKYDNDENIRCIDAAWAANVYIATHVNGFPLKSHLFKSDNCHWVKLNTKREDTPLLETKFKKPYNTQNKFNKVDVAIIHRTFLGEDGLMTFDELKKLAPLVFIESGGTSLSRNENEHAKFLPHDEMMSYFNTQAISKLGFSQLLLTLPKT